MREQSDEDIAAINRQLDEQLAAYGTDIFVSWLRAAYHTHKTKIARLRADHRELATLFLAHLEAPPLTVREAQLLNVCRICQKPATAPLRLNFGQEFAHEDCLAGRQS